MNLTKRKNKPKSGTGGRKTSKRSDENQGDGIGRARKARVIPRPRPVKRGSKVLGEASNLDGDLEDAALALVSLNKVKPSPEEYNDQEALLDDIRRKEDEAAEEWEAISGQHRESLQDSETTSSIGEGEDEDETTEDEEEVDELGSDDERLEIPLDSPRRVAGPPKPNSKEPFNIPIEVPYKNATRDVTGITSASSFQYAIRQIAERMDASPSQLSAIGYIPSYKPKNPKPVPKLLEDSSCWEKLVDDVRQYIASFAAKKGAAKTVKPFFIMIVNTGSPRPDKDREAKAGSSKKADASEHAAALTKNESRQLEALKRIEAHHMCQEHKKPCLVQLNGSHYQYSTADLAKWSILLVEGKALLGEPPAELNLTDAYRRQHTAKKAMNQTVAEQTSFSMMDFLQGMAGIMMMQNMANRAPTGIANPLSPMTPLTTGSAIPTTPSAGVKRPPSPIKAPSLRIWSADLASDPNRAESKLADYLEVLEANEINDLEDFMGFSDVQLTQITGMKIGLAKRLQRFATADLNALRRAKQPRLD